MAKTPYIKVFKIGDKEGKRKLEIEVVIHGSRKLMQKESKYRVPVVAFCRCFKDGKVGAVIHLAKGHLNRGTIAHESLHAASGILQRFRLVRVPMRFTSGQASDAEEKFAQYTGAITDAVHEVIRMGKFSYNNGKY